MLLVVVVDTDQVGDGVALLQGLKQEGAVGHVVREVADGEQGGDLLGEDGHLQSPRDFGHQPRFHLLRGDGRDTFA